MTDGRRSRVKRTSMTLKRTLAFRLLQYWEAMVLLQSSLCGPIRVTVMGQHSDTVINCSDTIKQRQKNRYKIADILRYAVTGHHQYVA